MALQRLALAAFVCAFAGPSHVAAAKKAGKDAPTRTQLHPPDWMDDEGKKWFYLLEMQKLDVFYGFNACKARAVLVEKSTGVDDKVNDQEAGPFRVAMQAGLGLCEMKNDDFAKAAEWFDMANKATLAFFHKTDKKELEEMVGVSKLVHIEQAAVFLDQGLKKEAAEALRKVRASLDTDLRSFMQKVVGMMKEQKASHTPKVEELMGELSGYGEVGEHLPLLVDFVPQLKMELSFSKLADQLLAPLNRALEEGANSGEYSLEL